mgnify:CR=1 FL=1
MHVGLHESGDDDEAAEVWADAATRFLAFQKEFPQSQFADKAVFNATIIYDNADKLDLAEAYPRLKVVREVRGEGAFLDFLKADDRVTLPHDQLEALFDLGYHTKNVDVVFKRVFGEG